jgi:RNA polymerase sigma-54 factor
MQATQEMATTPRLEMRPSATLVAAMELLGLPTADVERLVEAELRANPAMERETAASEPVPRSLAPSRRNGTAPEAALEAMPGLADTLRADVRLDLAERDRPVAEYLLGSLDEHGFLDVGPDDVASSLGVPATRVARVLEAIREAAPPGVGARDVRECLLLQLARMPEGPRELPLARTIVSGHLKALASGRYGATARALGVERAEVLAARDFIRTRLRPYPTLRAPDSWSRTLRAPAPDIVIHARRGPHAGFAVEVLEPRRLALVISPSYASVDAATLDRGARGELAQQLHRAHGFLTRLERRWATVQAVAECVVDRQRDFLVRGPEALRPLTRRQVADALGFHESTVSRAVAGRDVMLPCRRVVPLAAFFEAAGGPRAALARAIAGERRPLTDAELAAALARAGFPIARRTVAKYREQLGIPAQPLR